MHPVAIALVASMVLLAGCGEKAPTYGGGIGLTVTGDRSDEVFVRIYATSFPDENEDNPGFASGVGGHPPVQSDRESHRRGSTGFDCNEGELNTGWSTIDETYLTVRMYELVREPVYGQEGAGKLLLTKRWDDLPCSRAYRWSSMKAATSTCMPAMRA